MKLGQKGNKGFTLIEVLIVIALIAVLAAVVVPNVVRYLGKGEQEAYNSDEKSIQVAADGYYTETVSGGKHIWPIKGGTGVDKTSGGTPVPTWTDDGDGVRETGEVTWTSGGKDTSGYFIDFDVLLSGKFLKKAPKSASVDNKTGYTGHYGWFVDANGAVGSIYYDDPTKSGFQTGIYP